MKEFVPRRLRRELEGPVTGLQREMNKFIDNFFGTEVPWGQGEWSPRMDISETDTAVVVKAEVPGLEKEDVDVTVQGSLLTIKGEKKDERKESRGNYRLLERRYGSFQRNIPLPSGIDQENIEAEFKNGVLTVTLPKTEETQTKKIRIREREEAVRHP